MKTFKFYRDAGHGWLAVKRSVLSSLELENEISPYSYQKGGTVYLEEDCDATKFVDAWKAKFGERPAMVRSLSHPDWSPIRSYQSYQGK